VQGTKGAGISYTMESFFKDCVAQYVRLTGYTGGFRAVATPFLAEDQNTSIAGRTPQPLKGAVVRDCPWCRIPIDVKALAKPSEASAAPPPQPTLQTRGVPSIRLAHLRTATLGAVLSTFPAILC
jgi:hypothetical protein